jgi:type II secretory pathway pseudopilin PulG
MANAMTEPRLSAQKRAGRGQAIEGFTLVELLTCVAVLVTLMGLLMPVIVAARKSGLRTVSISNMRQCYLALTLYAGEADVSEALPTREAAWQLLDPKIIHDPADTWNGTADMKTYPGMVGSFGYVNAKLCYTSQGVPVTCVGDVFRQRFPVLISVFYGPEPIPAYDYTHFNFSPMVYLPPRALALWTDGRVRLENVERSGKSLMSWATLFVGVNHAGRRKE